MQCASCSFKLLFFLYGSEHTAGAPQWQKSHPFEKRAISRCQFVKNFERMEKVIFFMVQNIQQGRLNIKKTRLGQVQNLVEKRAISRRQSVKNFKRMENVIGSIYHAITSIRRN